MFEYVIPLLFIVSARQLFPSQWIVKFSSLIFSRFSSRNRNRNESLIKHPRSERDLRGVARKKKKRRNVSVPRDVPAQLKGTINKSASI